ncbi:MAG: AbiH family protein [Lachnospiraceae bacterium]|nr:AbiH family protein [Lachnospiraceae bacterium]
MSNNVLVIGNGFDLAHGLKTSYNNFIEYIKEVQKNKEFIPSDEEDVFFKECVEKNGFIQYFLGYTNEVPGWVDLERLIREVVGYFELFFSRYEDIIDTRNSITWESGQHDMSDNWKLKTINCLDLFPLFDQDNTRDYMYSKHLDRRLYTDEYGLNKREILRMLKSQLDDVIKLLQIYLSKHIKDEMNEPVKPIEQISVINPSYVISFNYTDTYKVYGINPDDVFHVHGSLDKDNMVLGFNDDAPEELDFVYFKKYFQRIQKLTGYIDSQKMVTFSKGIEQLPRVHFYGHSMDKTDGDIIEQLMSMSKGFIIYTYDQEDYEQKVINLIDVFGKERAIDMIQNKIIQFIQCE